ncbi:alpha/beta hydrolase [Gordonia neofelifaecis]|uniref:Acyl-CoA:diacylglycerol acyltransferase n=1 Tax=Gordonia neofelifaecis NRRL B-59395 TaxID=644548 RepID=F1YII4_9ACTN|nr:alpha/beta hydrolase family protein [Gordonia neofelifaecis]EGD55292.1 mycolyltransferase [Gordonia neofelifaecis NRRL B-59395]
MGAPFRPRLRRRAIVVALAALTVAAAVVGATATARPAAAVSLISVYSPSMNRTVTVHVLHPPGRPAGLPTVYMLPGAGGAEDGISWLNNTPIREFFAGKRVNVVLPIGGAFSMMTDWNAPDPVLGRNRWQTFVTRDLPAAVHREFRVSAASALTGVSMSAGPALDIATQVPGRYRAVAAYSGCPGTTDPLGALATTAIVSRGGGNIINMWGPPGSPEWFRHDPVVNAARLRGTAIYLSAGSGVPGPIDGNPLHTGGGLVGGNIMEAVALGCTTNMSNRLGALGIGHRFVRRPDGVHTWGLFYADLRNSWPMIARAIGA